jgi:hypothetical protein
MLFARMLSTMSSPGDNRGLGSGELSRIMTILLGNCQIPSLKHIIGDQ